MFTSQIYPYLQKHSGVPWTKIAILKRAFFVEPLRGGWWSELNVITNVITLEAMDIDACQLQIQHLWHQQIY